MLFKKILAVFLAIGLFSTAYAESFIARQGKDYVLVHKDKSCENKAILALIPKALAPQFHAAEAVVGGQKYQACFIESPQGVILVYEDGDQGLVPYEAFTKLKEV